MDFILVLGLMAITFIAHFFAVVTGGAGLIMTPLLITAGFPPVNAIALNQFSQAGSAVSGTIQFHRNKQIDYRVALPLIIFAGAGSIAGAFTALSIDQSVLENLIGFMLLGILILIILNRDVGEDEHPVRLTAWRVLVGGILVSAAVIFGTLAGGGVVILMTYILILLFGESFLHSAGTQKILNDVAFLTVIGIFIYKGVIDFRIALPLLAASTLGGWFGSMYGISHGSHWVKNVFMVAIILLATKLILF